MPVVKKVVHNRVSAVLRAKGEKVGPLTVEECKELIGWEEEPADKDWGDDFALKDLYKRKIRLTNNPSNRPFRRPLADRYANEHLRGEWALNLETIVADKFGFITQGQHRLVGLILGEQLRQLDPERWGKSPLVYETLVGFGVDAAKTANTYDLGAKRSLDDVIYRHERFDKKTTDKQQRMISKTLAVAIRLVWLRSGGKQVSFAPHFPHSEALEFYKEHPGILDAVQDIVATDTSEEYAGGGCISSQLSLGYASALHYLMSDAESREKSLEFWQQFASGEGLTKGSPILALKQFLNKTDAGSGAKRDQIIGAVIKTWLLWVVGKTGGVKDIKIGHSRKADQRGVLTEFPRIGGLDSELDIDVELTQKQLMILKVLKGRKKESTYKELTELTGLTLGPLSSEIMEVTRAGKENPHSLVSRGLVSANQYEPQNGKKAPYFFKLKK